MHVYEYVHWVCLHAYVCAHAQMGHKPQEGVHLGSQPRRAPHLTLHSPQAPSVHLGDEPTVAAHSDAWSSTGSIFRVKTKPVSLQESSDEIVSK